ncbi:MAG: multicopper oxidase domain-containing protein [Bacteroidales bacterium]|jgi:bilirubin oxidase|nr:multicopper oxidase domain-containing protein [Bacteroidales bacterium]
MKTKLFILITNLLISSVLIAQNPVIIPETLSGTEFNLTLQNGTFQFLDGQVTNTMGVNGDILGPTLIMQKDDFVDITVNNNLDETTTIHWHGMHVSAANDGGPHTTILPGEIWNPQFTVMDKAGTYWYHPHLHEKTNEHVSKGIAGFIIVRDEEEAALELPRAYGIDDFPLVIQTKDFDANNQVVTPSNSDDVLMVNATIVPVLEVPAQVVRFRLLNGSSMRVFNIGLSDNSTFYQIGTDGGLLSESASFTRLQLAPGERAEILINFSGMEGQTTQLMSHASELQNGIYGATYPGMMTMMTLDGYNPNPLNGNDFDIISFQVDTPTENPVTTVASTLAELNPIPEEDADITRNLNFTPEFMGPDQLNGNFLINGVSFDMDVINYTIPLNNTEIWSIINQSGIAHPFHIHDVQFFVLDRNGSPPPISEQGRKDVILVKPQETVRFITKFEDFANDTVPYMAHCHMLVHEDDGMMLQFEVVDEITDINGNNVSENIEVFPNPVRENTMLTIADPEIVLEKYVLFDLQGNKILEKQIVKESSNYQIELFGIDKGMYILQMNTNNNSFSKKVIVE